MDLNDKQKAFLDDCEDPAVLALWMLERYHEGYDHLVIKNGQQMTFRGPDLMRAAGDYLYERAVREIQQ